MVSNRKTILKPKDMDDCEHDCGTYVDHEDYSAVLVERCNLCDIVMNLTKEEYYDNEL